MINFKIKKGQALVQPFQLKKAPVIQDALLKIRFRPLYLHTSGTSMLSVTKFPHLLNLAVIAVLSIKYKQGHRQLVH
jgi:hypothetical protein